MSLGQVSRTGAKVPIAGLNGLSGELVPSVSIVRQGVVGITVPANGMASFTITFDTPMPDTDYCVELSTQSTGRWTAGVQNKAVNGFSVQMYSHYDQSVNHNLQYTAFKLMTDESRALDEAAIAANTTALGNRAYIKDFEYTAGTIEGFVKDLCTKILAAYDGTQPSVWTGKSILAGSRYGHYVAQIFDSTRISVLCSLSGITATGHYASSGGGYWAYHTDEKTDAVTGIVTGLGLAGSNTRIIATCAEAKSGITKCVSSDGSLFVVEDATVVQGNSTIYIAGDARSHFSNGGTVVLV